ncbi:MAG: pilus assembly protein PilM [Syntrophomonadaceae bacterium]
MFDRRKAAPGIGLAVDVTQATLTRVKQKKGKLQVIGSGNIPVPAGTADAGLINDPVKLGQALGYLVERMNLKGKQVISSLGGPQVFIRNLVLPRMKINELKEAALFEATTFLPIPVEEAAIDVYPVRHFEDEDGKQTELFFVAVRRQQVEDLRLTCEVAGLDLVAVELDPIALHRVMVGADEEGPQAYLYMGTTRSFICVMKNGALIFQRYFSSGTSAISQALDPEQDPHQVLFQVDMESSHQYLVRDMITQASRSLEYFRVQFNDELKTPLILCGTGARIRGLDKTLSEALDHKVIPGDISGRLLFSSRMPENERQDLTYDYLISLGLAAREVV